jgi:glyoxylate carboligase
MKVTGLAAALPSMSIVTAPAGTDFSELIKNAKSGADFKLLYSKIRNNADAALYVRALREFSAEAPFRALAQQGGGQTAKQQAFEDLHWALLNCSEFLTNH